MSIMWSNFLVGGITLLALILLFWPLISKVIRLIRPAPVDTLAAQQPVD
jgi:putative tricarboxylic transport membrane protein